MGHVVIRKKRNVVGDELQYVTLFRCIEIMNLENPYNTCYTGGELVCYYVQLWSLGDSSHSSCKPNMCVLQVTLKEREICFFYFYCGSKVNTVLF